MQLQAKGASFLAQDRNSNPLDLVKEAIVNFPDADRKTQFQEFERLIEGMEDYERVVRWYFFVNMHDNLTRKSRPAPKSESRAARAAKMAEIVKDIKSKIVLLDLKLPSGKSLRASTFGECAQCSGFFGRLAKKGKPNQIVGEVFTEDQVRSALGPTLK